ncbi:hypothetical protein HaLaN_24170, partial [Haematococcus lacustris]
SNAIVLLSFLLTFIPVPVRGANRPQFALPLVTPAIGCTPVAQEIPFLLIFAPMRPPIGQHATVLLRPSTHRYHLPGWGRDRDGGLLMNLCHVQVAAKLRNCRLHRMLGSLMPVTSEQPRAARFGQKH